MKQVAQLMLPELARPVAVALSSKGSQLILLPELANRRLLRSHPRVAQFLFPARSSISQTLLYGQQFMFLSSIPRVANGFSICTRIYVRISQSRWHEYALSSVTKGGKTCLRRLASVSTLYKDRYMNARTLVNHIIMERILSNKS